MGDATFSFVSFSCDREHVMHQEGCDIGQGPLCLSQSIWLEVGTEDTLWVISWTLVRSERHVFP